MTDHKKAWVKPELIVLVRKKPEEAVLTFCKTSGESVGPFVSENSCSPQGWGGCAEISTS